MVLEYVNARLDDLISKHLESKLNSNCVQNMILNRVTHIMENGIPNGHGGPFWTRLEFDDYVAKVIRRVIEDKLVKEYNAELKLVHKDTNIVGKF